MEEILSQKKSKKNDNISYAKIIEIIETKSKIGTGIEKDPVRYIYHYWDFKGNLLFYKDSYFDSTIDVASSDINS